MPASIVQTSRVIVPTADERAIISEFGISLLEEDSILLAVRTQRNGGVLEARVVVNDHEDTAIDVRPADAIVLVQNVPRLVPQDGNRPVRMHPLSPSGDGGADGAEGASGGEDDKDEPGDVPPLVDVPADSDDESDGEVADDETAAIEAARVAQARQAAVVKARLELRAAEEAEAEAKRAARAAAKPAAARKAATPRVRKPTVRPATESKAAALDGEFATLLEDSSLGGLADAFRKAGVLNLLAFMRHTIAELEESFQRPTIKGAKFIFSSVERRMLKQMGMDEGEPLKPQTPGAVGLARPTAALPPAGADLAAWLASKGLAPAPAPGASPPEPPSALAGEEARKLFEHAPHTAALCARVPFAELDAKALDGLTRQLARVFEMDDVLGDTSATVTLESAVDTLDSLLMSGDWEMRDLAVDGDGMRALNKFVVRMCMLKRKQAPTRDTPRPSPTSDEEQMNLVKSVAGSILDSSQQATSAADHKAAAEIAASEKRLKAVTENAMARAALKEFAQTVQSSAKPQEKLAAYAEVSDKFATVAELLKSSHVRAPKGAAHLESPHAQGVVGDWREAKGGLLTAARDVLRRMLPVHADAMKLAEAVFSGKMDGSGDFSIRALSEPAKPASWLGKPTQEGEAQDKGKPTVAILVTAMPAILYAFTVLQPQDKVALMTLTEVNAEVSTGLKRSGVAGAVDTIYAPLMRAYTEKMDAFQKSVSAPLPVLSTIWAEERTRAVEAYSLHAGSPAAPGATPAAAESATVKAMEGKVKKIESLLGKIAKKVKDGGYQSGVESEDEDDDEDAPKKKKKKKKTTAQKTKELKAQLKEAQEQLAVSAAPSGV
jgi:hypothetical protein